MNKNDRARLTALGACSEAVAWVAVLTARLAQREAAIADLIAETCECCGTCAHSDESQAPRAGETHCTRPSGYFNGRLMPLSARCADHTAREDA